MTKAMPFLFFHLILIFFFPLFHSGGALEIKRMSIQENAETDVRVPVNAFGNAAVATRKLIRFVLVS